MTVDLTNDGEELAFLNGLKQYLYDKGKVLIPYPRLAGCEINLHDLYNKVTALGGYQKVTDRNLWVDLLKEYNFNEISATLSYGLKIIYQRFLEEYERVHYFGDDEGSKKPRFDVSIRLNRRSTFLSDFDRHQLGLNSSLRKNSSHNYDRLAFSLMSCLPNEVDFAINACTLLSGESRHVLRLSRCPQVLEALLLHAGIASEDLGSLAGLAETWLERTKHNLIQFWQNTVANEKVLDEMLYVSALCKCAKSNRSEETSDESCTTKCSICCLNISKHKPAKKNQPKWSSLFQSTRSAGVQDYEGQRVLQIALVLLNLSFEEFNLHLLASNKPLVRFAFLCVHSSYSALRQTGLDILGNISTKMDLLSLGMDILECMYRIIDQCILSPDKFDKVRGYEILGNLCRSPSNKDCVVSLINDDIYSSSLQLLSLGDVELLLAALDALYHMSKLGEEPCTKIMMVSGSIDVLICLITLNVRALGSECLSRIRIVKRIPPSGVPSGSEARFQQPQQGASVASSHTHHSNLAQSNAPRPPGFAQHSHSQYHAVAASQLRHAPSQPAAHLPQAAHVQPNTHVLQHKAHVVQQNAHFPSQSAHFAPQAARLPLQNAPIPPQKLSQVPHPNVILPQSSVLPQQNVQVHQKPPAIPVIPQHTQYAGQQIPQNAALVFQPPTSQMPHLAIQTPMQQKPSQTFTVQQTSISVTVKTVSSASQKPKKQSKAKKTEHKKAKPSTSSKPSASSVYTHTESQLEPPVYHYMPAPPSNIVLNKSPESFAQLWVWASYEACGNEEGSTPRVEVFAEYAAAATRYGMHGTKQVLPATEFGKCLQQVFPLAASRLFKDEKGQPMYHITGIKKRPTPLPVPGHHPEAKTTTSETNCETVTAQSNKTVAAGATSSDSSVTNDVKCAVTSNITSSNATSTVTSPSVTTESKPSKTTSDTNQSTAATSMNITTTSTTSTAVTSHEQSAKSDSTANCENVEEKTQSPKSSETETQNCVNNSQNKSVQSVACTRGNEIALHLVTTNCNDSAVNHCSNSVDSQTVKPSAEKTADSFPSNHCDAIKSGKVNGNSESLEAELVKKGEKKLSPTSEGPSKFFPEPANTIKCNGDLSPDEKENMEKQNHLSVAKANHKSSKDSTQLMNGLLEETKPDILSKNGDSHKEARSTVAVKAQVLNESLPNPSKFEEKVKDEPAKLPVAVDFEKKPESVQVKTKPVAKKRSHSQSSIASNPAPPPKVRKSDHIPKTLTNTPRLPTPGYVVQQPPPSPHQVFYPNPKPSLPSVSVYIPRPHLNHPTGSTAVTPHSRHPVPQVAPSAAPAPQQSPLPSKLPVIDLMAPNASLLVLLRNSGKYQFDDSTDEKEDPISKSIRLTAVLILINICLYSNEGRSHLQRHEPWLAYLSMSSMDCSPMIAKLLSEMDR